MPKLKKYYNNLILIFLIKEINHNKPSAKINIIIIPVNNRGCNAFALTPTSPITPIHIPAPNPENPTANPPPR